MTSPCFRHYKLSAVFLATVLLVSIVALLHRQHSHLIDDVITRMRRLDHVTGGIREARGGKKESASSEASQPVMENNQEPEPDAYDVIDILDSPTEPGVGVEKSADNSPIQIRVERTKRGVMDWLLGQQQDDIEQQIESNSTDIFPPTTSSPPSMENITDNEYLFTGEPLDTSTANPADVTTPLSDDTGDDEAVGPTTNSGSWSWLNDLLMKAGFMGSVSDQELADLISNITGNGSTVATLNNTVLPDSEFTLNASTAAADLSLHVDDVTPTELNSPNSQQLITSSTWWDVSSCQVTSSTDGDVCDDVTLAEVRDVLLDVAALSELYDQCRSPVDSSSAASWCLRKRGLSELTAEKLSPYCNVTSRCLLPLDSPQQCQGAPFLLDTLDLLCAVSSEPTVTSHCVTSLRMLAHVTLVDVIALNSLTVTSDMPCICEACNHSSTILDSVRSWLSRLLVAEGNNKDICDWPAVNDSSSSWSSCDEFLHLLPPHNYDVVALIYTTVWTSWRPEVTSVFVLLSFMMLAATGIVLVAYCVDWGRKELSGKMDRSTRGRIEYSVISSVDLSEDSDSDLDEFSIGLGPILKKSAA